MSGLLGDIGLLNKWGIGLFPDTYNHYQKRAESQAGAKAWEDFQQEKNLQQYRQPNVRIVVVGCWDTVGSLGVPENWLARKLKWNKRYEFYDTQLSSSKSAIY